MISSLALSAFFFLMAIISDVRGESNGQHKDFEVRILKSIIIIECYTSSYLTDHLINTTNYDETSSFNELVIHNCALPDSENIILNIIKKFNVQINSLKLGNMRKKLVKSQLQGLNLKNLTLVLFGQSFDVSEDLLYGLTTEELNILGENFNTVPNQFFLKSLNLKNPGLINTNLIEINSNILLPLSNLDSLTLHGSVRLEKIALQAFNNLIKLRHLWIQKFTKLTSLPEGIFKNLQNLEKLVFFENKFDFLGKDLLNNIKEQKIKEFQLSDNTGNLSTLPGEFFKKLKHVEFMYLASNSFTSLPEELFFETKSLITLNMKNNKLDNLPPNLFKNTMNLIFLDISGNKLRNIPKKLFQNTRLKTLILNNNQLTRLSP